MATLRASTVISPHRIHTPISTHSFSNPRRQITHSASTSHPFANVGARASTNINVNARDRKKVLRMLMFGKPGAGKGTLTARLVKKYDIVSLSTGDLLRQHIAERTEVGREAEEIVASGGLLPDEMVLKVVTSRLDKLHNKHWILDGFPRTLAQGELLDKHLKTQHIPLSLVINLDVPDEVNLSRISDRWVHLPSGRVYNMSYNRPKVDGLDDETGEALTKRPDDNPEVYARRLAQFYESTSPLLSYYETLSRKNAEGVPKLVTLQGTTSDEIWPRLEGVLKSSFPGIREREERRARHSLSEAVIAEDLGVLARDNGKAMMEAWAAAARWSA